MPPIDIPGLPGVTVDQLVEAWAGRIEEGDRTSALSNWSSLETYREIFVKAGADAVADTIKAGPWIQFSVATAHSAAHEPSLLKQIRDLVHRLLDETAINNFFFLRKPPGLRLRFEATESAAAIRSRVDREVGSWKADSAIDGHWAGVYEPESRLFGGEGSMRHVHALFTLDSLLWLEHFAGTTSGPSTAVDVWDQSFAAIRALLAGLGVVGWEDIGVWQYIVNDTGRRLEPGQVAAADDAALRSSVIDTWEAAGPTASVAPRLTAGIREAAARWRAGYFDRSGARIGPRQAAAYVVIHHWNRANLSPVQQATVAMALAGRRDGERLAWSERCDDVG